MTNIFIKLRNTMCYRMAGYSGYLLPIVYMCLYLLLTLWMDLCDGFGALVCMAVVHLYSICFFVFFVSINLLMLLELYLRSKNITANAVKIATILWYIIFTAIASYYLDSGKSFNLSVFMLEWIAVCIVFAALLLLDKIIGVKKIRKLVDVGYILLIVFLVYLWVYFGRWIYGL